QLQEAAKLAGEKFWPMPLEEKYFEGLKSPIADMKNTGPRPGGSITAALFLKQFINNTPWLHLDIAGPVWSDKENGVNNSGATGFPGAWESLNRLRPRGVANSIGRIPLPQGSALLSPEHV
ncbi:MAG: hypothetical protein ACKO90_33805, partial [Microcystis panniformis]